MGSGTKVYPPAAVSLHEVFNNSTTSFNCQAGGTTSPTATDNRQVVMQFNDGGGWQTLPQMAINAVPFANYATRAESLGAYAATAYLRPSTLPTCTASQALTWDGSTFTCTATGGGGSTYTGVTSIANASGDITLAPAAGTGAIRITSNTPSTSTTTGAVVVTGGLGVSGAINSGGNITTSGTITSSGNMTTTGSLTAGTSAYIPQLYGTSTPSGNIHIDGTSNATKGNVLLASAGGNVGIGNSNPQLNLDVTGSIRAFSSSSIASVQVHQSSADTFPPVLAMMKGRAATTMPLSGDGLGVLSFNNYQGTGSASISSTATENHAGATGIGADLLFKTTSNGTTASQTRMRITSSGNVGIGTTSPAYALSVSGDVNVTGNFRVNGTVFTGGGGGAMTGVTSISNASGDITLAPAVGTGSARVNSGVASTSPTTGALIVTGGIGASGGIYSGGAISSGSSVYAVTSMFTPQLYGTSTPSGNILIDGTSNATKGNVLLASAGGKVGIGTTTPLAPLDVRSASTATTGTISGSSQSITFTPSGNAIGLTGVGTASSVSTASAQTIGTVVGSQSTVTKSSTGTMWTALGTQGTVNQAANSGTMMEGYGVYGSYNVTGAGMTNTGAGVKGSIQVTGAATSLDIAGGIFDVTINNGAASATGVKGISTAITLTSGAITNGYGLHIGNIQATNKWSIYANDATAPSYLAGNLGIGTTSPAAKLSVSGTTQFNGSVRQVAGQFSGAAYNNGAAVSFNLDNGNVQYTSASCQAMTLSNMQDGGTYTIAVKGTTAGTCTFTHAGLTFYYSPAQGSTANGSHSTYTFLRVGNDVYVTWIALYQ